MDLAAYIRSIPDFPKPGILFKDITPLLADPHGLANVVEAFAARYAGRGIDKVVAMESRGFIFANDTNPFVDQAGREVIRQCPREQLVGDHAQRVDI